MFKYLISEHPDIAVRAIIIFIFNANSLCDKSLGGDNDFK